MDLGVQLFRVFGGLLLILILLGGAAFGMKKFGRYGQVFKSDNTLEVLSRHHLDPRNSLLVVKVYGDHFLLGVSSQGVQMLAAVTPRPLKASRAAEGASETGGKEATDAAA